MAEFEDILEEIGGFGPLQIQVFILVSMFETPAAWGLLVHPVFASRTPPWKCRLGNQTVNESLSAPSHLEGNCSLYERNQCSHIEYDGEYTSIASEWDLICDRAALPRGLIRFLEMFGVLVGACVTGLLADKFGRKRVLFLVYGPFLVCGLASAFANSWVLYLILRTLVGAFFGGVMVVNFVLPLEFITPKWRTFCGCIGFWACGLMSLALLAYLLPDWRHLTIACFVGGVPLLFTWWFIPESPRWLLVHNRQAEAEKILEHIAKRNKRPVPDFSKLETFVQREISKRETAKNYNYFDLCRDWKMTKTTVIILYSWFVSSVVYYGTTLGTKHLHGNRFINFFLSGLVEIPALIFVVAVNNRFGRRKTLSFLMSLAGISCISVLVVNLLNDEEGTLSRMSVAFALIGKSAISGGWAAAQVSSAELFPTVVRNIGIGSSSMAARVGLLVAPELADLAIFHQSIPYVLFGALAGSCGLLVLLLPETLNVPLPDILPPRILCTSCVGNPELGNPDVGKTDVEEPLKGTAGDMSKDPVNGYVKEEEENCV